MKELVILGSTGSIGTQTLDIVRENPKDYKVTALASGRNIDLLEKQAREFNPQVVAVGDTAAAKDLKLRLKDTDIRVLSGEDGVCEAASGKGDVAINAIVGIAGLRPTLAAIRSGKTIALANKETLVTAGDIVKRELRANNVSLLPVDSEHSAIFQSLQGTPRGRLSKIILTASGGPFYSKKREELINVTPADALKHPNWSMGAKITIDSATLMNKGLEVIEAVHLFDVTADDIEVLVHRQSILHSAVEFCDGGVIAQLGTPDMKLPIQYALTYPDRKFSNAERLNLSKIGSLTFEKPDTDTFRCLPLCIKAINEGGLKPAAANGANEEAVKLFLDGKIKFLQIADLVEAAIDNQSAVKSFDVSDVFGADMGARELVQKFAK